MPANIIVEFDSGHMHYHEHGLPESVLDVALHFGVHLEHACGGSCACTTCHVIVKSGDHNLSEMEECEEDRLDMAPGLTLHSRLGCQAVIKGDVVREIPKWNRNYVTEKAPGKCRGTDQVTLQGTGRIGMEHNQHAGKASYRHLSVEMAIDFVIMYLAMYTMIATLDHFYLNLNNVYMTLMMVAPMTILMLWFMRSMYPSPRLNAVISVGAALVFIASFAAMRTQTAIGNAEFLRSMIPHHSGAILMCEQASITDPEIVTLCRDIVEAQKKEIAQMQKILARY